MQYLFCFFWGGGGGCWGGGAEIFFTSFTLHLDKIVQIPVPKSKHYKFSYQSELASLSGSVTPVLVLLKWYTNKKL